MNEPNPQLKIEDLHLSPGQLEAIEAGRRATEARRAADERAADLIAANNPPYKPLPWWKRVLRRWFA